MARGRCHFFWENTQAVEMAVYLCGELPQQAIFNQIYVRGADCEKRTAELDLAVFFFHKYPEARVRAYRVLHVFYVSGEPAEYLRNKNRLKWHNHKFWRKAPRTL